MRDTELYQRVLGLSEPWSVRRVHLNVQDWTGRTDVQTPGYYVKQQYLWGDPERFPEPEMLLRPFNSQLPSGSPQIPANAPGWHYLHDVLGSVIGMVDDTGQLVERYTYDPYGKPFIEKWDSAANDGAGDWVLSAEPTSGMPYSAYGNPWMWTGQRYDAVVGKYAFLMRTYDSIWGRFLQHDPIGYAGGSINLYEYVLSSPLTWADPFGLEPDDYEDAIRERRNNTRNEIENLKLKTAELVLEQTEPENLIITAACMTPLPGDEVAAAGLAACKKPLGRALGKAKNVLKKGWGWLKGKLKRAEKVGDLVVDAKGLAKACPKTRPSGVPDGWIHKPSKKGGGDQWINPKNPHDRVREMPRNPDSPNPAQQKPYVKRMKDGKALDKHGNPVSPDSPESHIPKDEFKFTE